MLPKASRNLPSSLLLFLLLSVFLPFGTPLSFNFPSFNASTPTSLNLQGDAFWNRVIQLTKNNIGSVDSSTGSAVQPKPLHLWDPVTGNVTDFTTHFSFQITSTSNISTCSEFCSGDGLAFFLAPYPYTLPANSSGGYLGLFYNDSALDTSRNHLVAVEFDTYPNKWDPQPSNYHVGIDVNSIKSAAYADCSQGITRGGVSNATITYTSSTQNLTVLLTYNDDVGDPDSIGSLSLSHVVDFEASLPPEVAVGFSATTGSSIELHQLLSWDFSSTLLAPAPPPAQPKKSTQSGDEKDNGKTNYTQSGDEKDRGKMNGIQSSRDEKGNSKIKQLTGVLSGVGAVMIVSGLLWFILWYKMAKKHKKDEDNVSIDSDEMENGRGPRRFSFNELAAATNNFAEEQKLGEGGFGMVYKGLLIGEEVAIKRVSAASKQGKKEYLAEVKIISQLRHRNLVQLVGWCHGKGELLLAYKFMSNGSLDRYLYYEDNFLTWMMRYKIAKNIASALLYLHEEWEHCVVHRDIKPSNVMLDSAFNAKLGDFGLAKLIDHELGSMTTVLAGTPGYMAPESYEIGRATKESDVYSFGVVALQLASGRKPIEAGKIKLVEWVWELYGDGVVRDAADERLQRNFDEKEMLCLLVVGLWCVHPYPSQRPSIWQALAVLNHEAPVPNLPLEIPILVATKGKSGRALVEDSVSTANSASTGFAASSSSQSMWSG